jgi:predicted transcriptional regulator
MSHEDDPSRRTVNLTDPRAMRALAHPTRLRLVAILRREGPLTATGAAAVLGESSGSCSYHLRQLAKYGLVEESGGGEGREKPWRATAQFTSWPNVPTSPAAAAASQQLATVIAEKYVELLLTWLKTNQDEPVAWQEAAQFGDSMVYLTAEELTELGGRVRELVERYADRTVDRSLRPAGSRLVSYLHLAFSTDHGDRPRVKESGLASAG